MDEQNQQQNQETAPPSGGPSPQQSGQPQQAGAPQKAKGYGKRPLWQWIVLYLVIGGVLYLAIYYFFLRGGSGY